VTKTVPNIALNMDMIFWYLPMTDIYRFTNALFLHQGFLSGRKFPLGEILAH